MSDLLEIEVKELLFTRLAGILAWLGVVLGISRIAMGAFVASIDDIEQRTLAARSYIGRRSSGEAIDQGIYMVLAAVVLGVIVEISKSLAKRQS